MKYPAEARMTVTTIFIAGAYLKSESMTSNPPGSSVRPSANLYDLVLPHQLALDVLVDRDGLYIVSAFPGQNIGQKGLR